MDDAAIGGFALFVDFVAALRRRKFGCVPGTGLFGRFTWNYAKFAHGLVAVLGNCDALEGQFTAI